ncbi:MAG: IclR family transcriptional regulator [Gammaproteobacteria bacterium]
MNEKTSQPTVLRGLIVLEKVVEARRPISATDLLEELDFPKPTVNRLLQQLEAEGLLQREPVKRRYLPGPRAKSMALGILSHKTVGAPRHAILSALSEEVGETCNCAMRDGGELVYFDRVESNWPYRIQLPVGSHLPLHCTASGKLLLAHMESRQRNRLLRSTPLEKYTDATITDPDELIAELKKIKADGVGFDDEEFLAGMNAIAVPVLNNEGAACFTVAIHAPTARKPLDELREHIPALRRAARAMEQNYCNTILEGDED